MPRPKKKPFVNKKNARTYHLVQSSTKSGVNKVQFKPHGHTVPWEEKDPNVNVDGQFDDADENDDIKEKNGNTSNKYDYSQHLVNRNNENDNDNEIFDDEFNDEDYDYYQHLKPIGGGVLISKEGNVVSNAENDFFDEDIQHALENDDNEVNDLDEDFIEKANDSLSGEENNIQNQNKDNFNIDDIDIGDIEIKDIDIVENDSDDQDDENIVDDENINGDLDEDDNEFNPYQMTLNNKNKSKDIQDYFQENKSDTKEKTFLEEKLEYAIMNDDSESDDLKVPGFDTKDYNNILDDFIKTNKKEQYQPDIGGIKDAIKQLAKDDNSSEEEKYDIVYIKEKPQWDVESILSTYTNTDNHPNILAVPEDEKAIKINKKGFPILENDVDEDKEETNEPAINEGVARNKNETKEEKKARKNALKEQRKNKREQKKDLKNEFRKEISRQQNMNAGRIVNKTIIQYTS